MSNFIQKFIKFRTKIFKISVFRPPRYKRAHRNIKPGVDTYCRWPGHMRRGACSRRRGRRRGPRRGTRCTTRRSTCRTASTAPLHTQPANFTTINTCSQHKLQQEKLTNYNYRSARESGIYIRTYVHTCPRSAPTRTSGCTSASSIDQPRSKK